MSPDVVGTSQLSLGLTHTQFTADSFNHPEAVAASKDILSGRSWFQNQHIMGWGADNPEPSPDEYSWESLDSRLELIRETNGVPVITLCCAPDWMKGGAPGETDWSNLDAAPRPEHFADFAELAAEVAYRYPDVFYYQVWNGLRGFYDTERDRWDYEAYTDLYNHVYRKLKAVNPEIAVGGPHVTMDSWSNADATRHPSKLSGPWGVMDQRPLDAVAYWLEHKEGADFITLDMSTYNKDDPASKSAFDSVSKIESVAKWVRDRTDLPLWAALWHPFTEAAEEWRTVKQSAILADALVRLIESHVEVALVWEPQGRGGSCLGCIWTDTRTPGGGQPGAAFSALDILSDHFAPGTRLTATRTSSPEITALSSPTATLLINRRNEPVQVSVNGTTRQLDPHELQVVSPDETQPGGTPAAAP